MGFGPGLQSHWRLADQVVVQVFRRFNPIVMMGLLARAAQVACIRTLTAVRKVNWLRPQARSLACGSGAGLRCF